MCISYSVDSCQQSTKRYSIIVHVKLEDLVYNRIVKLQTACGFMSGATIASSVPSVQISSVHYPLSSCIFLSILSPIAS